MKPKDKQDNQDTQANTKNYKEASVHLYHGNRLCQTDSKGYATPGNADPTKIVLDASEGFIPLWAANVNLRWRFNWMSLSLLPNANAKKQEVRTLLAEAVLMWGEAAPVKFTERNDAWDFEIIIKHNDDCNPFGCTLASAFFPDPGRHQLVIYPEMFNQSHKEQVDTMLHEMGHIFGLRHFFANISEHQWPSEIFGTHRPFSIMNYGENSELTDDDRSDLKRLYELVWSDKLKQINGTPIVQVKPFHTLRNL